MIIMAYIVIQGSKGFVSLVEKARVQQADGSSKVQTTRGICGLGVMTKEEYLKYQSWAHSFKDQEERKAMVLSSGRAIEIKEKTVKAVAADKQVKTTVKKPPIIEKVKLKQSKKDREKELQEQEKRVIKGMTSAQLKIYHADIALEKKELREKNKEIAEKLFKYPEGVTTKGKKEYLKIHEKTVHEHIKELKNERYTVGQAKAYSGLYGVRREKANLIRIDNDLKVCNGELDTIKKERDKL
jgi:hypothetical protein